MSAQKPPHTPHILSAGEKKKVAQESLHADRRRRLRQHSAEAVSYLVLIAGSLLVLLLAWIKTAWMLSRPPKFPFSLQYATVQDREATYALEFSDAYGVPRKTRAIPPLERQLPYVVLDGQPARAAFRRTFQPQSKKLELIIPRGIEPGTWSGRLMVRDTQQRDLASLPVSFTIADPYRLYKVGGVAFLLFTATWYSLLIWRRPSPRGRLLMTEILSSDRVGEPKLDVKSINHPWWRKWIWLPGRNRKRLHDLHKRLPEGEIVFRRRGMFKRHQRVAMDLKLASVETSGLVQTRVWPSSTKAARQIPQRPQASIPIEPDGTPWVVSTDTASDGKAISFTIHHPDKTPTKKP